MEMNLSGEPINAERAFVAGLVSKVVPAEDLLDETHKTAAKVKKYNCGYLGCLSREVTATYFILSTNSNNKDYP